ncbi:MAG TPA: LptE family protein [Candidatus Saccharimonadales bacterium]|nr:LptE family protein [Candidatus Saccharimonadales bacterium]
MGSARRSADRPAEAGGGGPRRPAAGGRWAGFPLAAALALASGCAYTTGTGIPSHITTVAIPTFGNQTVQYTLSQELTDAVVQRFVQDNHLRVVPQRQAQSVILATVLEYRNEVFGYTAAEQAQEYRVGVRVEVRFKDMVKNKDIWSDTIIKVSNYSTVPVGNTPAATEADGRKDVVAKVADEILSRTVSRW